jgi:hypothetical protein
MYQIFFKESTLPEMKQHDSRRDFDLRFNAIRYAILSLTLAFTRVPCPTEIDYLGNP